MTPRSTRLAERWEGALAACAVDLDLDALRSANSVSGYLLTAAFLGCLVFVGAHTDVGQQFFGFESLALWLWYLPSVVVGLLLVHRLRTANDSRGVIWLTEMATTVPGLAFLYLLMAESKGVSGVIAASVLILSSGILSSIHRVTWRRPFIPAAFVSFGAAAAWSVYPHESTAFAIVMVTTAISTMICFVVGAYSMRLHQVRSREHKLDAVVRAQLLTEIDDESSSSVTALASHYHDLSNSVQAAVATLEMLKFSFADETLGRDQTAVRIERLSQSLERVAQLTTSVRLTRSNARTAVAPVRVSAVIRSTIERIETMFPSVRIQLGEVFDLDANVLGGEPALARVMENLIINACEGDGRSRARRVDVSVSAPADGATVAICVRDDGPGFPVAALERLDHIRAYHTSKPNGSGLGLYVVDKIVRGSAGSLMCRNASGGQVDIVLPRAFPPVRSPVDGPKAVRPSA